MSDLQSMDEPPFKKPRTEVSCPRASGNPKENVEKPVEELAGDSFGNFVSAEELEKLREFKVLDEVNDEDSNEGDSDSSDGKSEGVPEEEIERMLEEDLPDGFKGAPKPKEKPYVTRQKIVLEEKGVNQFEVLPLDWMMVRHYSGIPVYIHRSTRVCTLSKPYFLGKGNTRRHDIPISAIPCLAYRRALEEEEKQKEIDKQIEEQIKSGAWQNLTANAQNTKHSQSNASQININNMAQINNKGNDNITRCPFINENNQDASLKKVVNVDGEIDPDTEKDCVENDNIILDPKTDKNCVENDSKILDDISRLQKDIGENNDEANQAEPIEQIENIKIEIVACDDDNDNSKNKSENENSFLITDNTVVPSAEASNIDYPNNEENNAHQNYNPLVGKDELIANLNDQGTSKDGQDINDSDNVNTNNESNENSQVVNGSESAVAVDNGPNTNTKISLNRQPVVLPGGIVMPPPRVETVNTSWKSQHLTYEQVNDYCRKLFKFKTVNIMHFMRWADRRKYTKARKTLQYPTLPEGTKLITIPAQPANGQDNGGKSNKRDWVMNMNGRSYLSVFHEYVRRALQKQPVYEFKQLENASSPYQATVYIGGMQYGVGHGSSKRSAKSAAARASIHILIPEMKADLDAGAGAGAAADHPNNNEPDFSFFDYVGIEDPRITEFCLAACEPAPHAILRTCLLRNFGAQDKHIHTEMKKLEYQKIELTMKVGKHTATVVCKNKKTAKQRASQAILQALHPHVRSWGSLLRLYGSRSVKSCKEKKLEEQQITLLQDAARHNEPNYAVLEKLRNEMRKLRERDEAVVPIGTLLVKDDLPTHSGSNLNNVDL